MFISCSDVFDDNSLRISYTQANKSLEKSETASLGSIVKGL